MSEKTICFFNSNKVWGGGEKWHFEFSKKLLNEGYRVFGITNSKSDLYDKFRKADIPVFPLKIGNLSFLNPFKVFKLIKYFRQNSINVVVLGLSCDIKLGGIAAKLAGVKKILYRRGSAIPVKNSPLNRYLFRKVLTGVIVNSKEIKRSMLLNNPSLIDHDKIHLLYNCVDSEAFSINSAGQSMSLRKNGELVLGNVGRMVDQKGQKYLIDIAGILKKEGIKFRLFIAGRGKLEKELKEYAVLRNVEDEVVFTGFVKDMEHFMKSIDIFLLSSVHEGSANVLLEAMACGKSIVAFDISSMGEIIEHKRTGYLVEFKDIRSFSDSVIMLAHNPALRSEMGNNARNRVVEKFSFDQALQGFLGIING